MKYYTIMVFVLFAFGSLGASETQYSVEKVRLKGRLKLYIANSKRFFTGTRRTKKKIKKEMALREKMDEVNLKKDEKIEKSIFGISKSANQIIYEGLKTLVPIALGAVVVVGGAGIAIATGNGASIVKAVNSLAGKEQNE